MVRSDLGIEIPAEKVFLDQKMIWWCNRAGKTVLCATPTLASTTKQPSRRAEGSDVALSAGTTASRRLERGQTGLNLDAVRRQSLTAPEAESAIYHLQLFEELRCRNPLPVTPQKPPPWAPCTPPSSAAGAITVLTKAGSLFTRWPGTAQCLCPQSLL